MSWRNGTRNSVQVDNDAQSADQTSALV
uniref:Uncharacterized protein n=1 Tax=Arundo donax TaxID=35708 RepID=A0A0A9E5N4_ARUDO